MKTFIVLSLLLVCTLAFRDLSKWDEWKKHHGRNYATNEELRRQKIFFRNLKKIEMHNKQADAGVYTYRLGLNQFADLTSTEFASKFHAKNNNLFVKRNNSFVISSTDASTPDSFDWRTQGVVAPVKSMGDCPASYAYSAVSAIESANAIALGNLTILSEQNIIDCSSSYGNKGCGDGETKSSFEYVLNNGGIDTAASYPNVDTSGDCKFNQAGIGAVLNGLGSVTKGQEISLKYAVATYGPISVGIDASSVDFQFYFSGVFVSDNCSSEDLNLSLVVVGYDSFNGQDYWIVRNSWGATWGLDGYIWMARNRNNMCGIATCANFPVINK